MNMNSVTLCVMARYLDIFEPFRASVEMFAPDITKILVRDDSEIPPDLPGWTVVQGPDQFSYAGNRNLGWRAVDPAHDIFDCTDDVRLTEPLTVERLREIAYADDTVGILSPKIIGGAGNATQENPDTTPITYTAQRLPLICTYVKRAAIETIGMMDEAFSGYGGDDVDFSFRLKQAGYRLGVTPLVSVQHGAAGYKWMATTLKRAGGDYRPMLTQTTEGFELFRKKWGKTPQQIGVL
jgi:GT2 family glycosyltransferase